MTKFDMDRGSGFYKVRAKFKWALSQDSNPPKTVPVQVEVHLGEEYIHTKGKKSCWEKRNQANAVAKLQLPANATWSE